ncbi:MAG: acyltransferase [Nocardioides sp.]|nr:acyltransferase [Nocardioides sp.]
MASFTPGWEALPEALHDFWTERHLLTLTTLRPDGLPHTVPVGVALDPEQECAWVISSGGSRKVRNLLAAGIEGGPVTACQVDGRRWSTIEGTAVVHHDPAAVARACERYAGRYRQPRPNPDRVALRIDVRRFLAGRDLLPD